MQTDFAYDANGLRVEKATGSSTRRMFRDGNGTLVAESMPEGTMHYLYDSDGSLLGFRFDPAGGNTPEKVYYYLYNAQGDVMGITDDEAMLVVKYSYDAWGNPLTITNNGSTDLSGDADHIANLNPFRYRGYYYDTETGFYYLQSRYYDPVTARFINADDPAMLGVDQGNLLQYNLFAYCGNNPVKYL